MLIVSVEDLGEVVVLHGIGRILQGEEGALLCSAVGQHGRDVVLDLSQVDGIDASGIGALIALQAAGVYLKIVNASRTIREALKVRGVDSIFEIFAAPSDTSTICDQSVPATAA